MNTRRQFLIKAPLGFLVATAACNTATPNAPQPAPQTPTAAGAPPTFGTGPGSGPPVTAETFAEAEKLVQITMTAAERQQLADSWRSSLAQYLERRTGPRKVALADTDAPATLWNPQLPGIRRSARDRSIRAIRGDRRAAAVYRGCDRVCAGDGAVAMDRIAATVVGAADADLSVADRSLRPEDPIGDHGHARTRAGARESRRCRDRRWKISRRPARHSIRREGSPRHQRHRDHLRRRALPQPRAGSGLRGGAQAERCRRRPGREALTRRAGAQRHLVRRPDDEPVAARGRRIGIERRTRRRHGRRAGRVLDRQRNRRQHRLAGDAMRCHRPAPDVRPRAAHGRHDPVLVARQARADDANGRGRDAGAAGDQRSGFGRPVERAESSRLRCGRVRCRTAGSATSTSG